MPFDGTDVYAKRRDGNRAVFVVSAFLIGKWLLIGILVRPEWLL